MLNGPTAASGTQCPEGWSFYAFPGPQMLGVTDSGSAEASYYVWVDREGILGLGKDVPIAMGNLNSGILALVDGKFVGNTPSTLQIPPGDHTITVQKNGFTAWSRSVHVVPGDLNVVAELNPDQR